MKLHYAVLQLLHEVRPTGKYGETNRNISQLLIPTLPKINKHLFFNLCRDFNYQ
jgi:hypothetical protein